MEYQSSSSNTMSKTSNRKFFTKMFSCCFHVQASTIEATASSSVPSSPHDQQQQQQQQQRQQEEEKLVIYVGGVGVDKESMVRYSVPWTYVSYPQFKKLLLEKSSSGEDLKRIRSEGGSVVIHCEVAEFEYVRKLVKSQERERICLERSYDDGLWSHYWKKKIEEEKEKSTTPETEKEKEKSTTPEIINNTRDHQQEDREEKSTTPEIINQQQD